MSERYVAEPQLHHYSILSTPTGRRTHCKIEQGQINPVFVLSAHCIIVGCIEYIKQLIGSDCCWLSRSRILSVYSASGRLWKDAVH